MLKLSDTINRKFIDTLDVDEWNIDSDMGWIPLTHIHKTIEYQEWIIETSFHKLTCADTHILFDENLNEVFAKDLIPNKSFIATKYGFELVTTVICTEKYSNMFDVTVDSNDHRFYTNGILSHNSAIMDAIVFALFGKPHRDVTKNQLINSINQKNCMVEIWFSVDGVGYQIRRGIKPNVFEIFKDGTLIDQEAATRDYQKFLETQVLKTNVRAFTQSVILGAASFTPFMKMRAHERREVIEDFLDIKIFGVMHQILKEEIQATKADVIRSESKFTVAKTQVQGQKNLIMKLEEMSNQVAAVITNKIESYEAVIQEYKTILTSNSEKIADLRLMQSGMETARRYVLDLRDRISNNNHQLKVHSTDIEFFESNSECPSCKQDILDHHRKPIVKQMAQCCLDIRNESDELKREFDKANASYDQFLSYDDDIQKLHDSSRELNRSIRSTEALIDELESELVSTESSDVMDEKLKLKNMATGVMAIIDEKTKLSDLRCLQDQAYDILRDGGVKTTIIREYLPVINRMINHYLNVMEFFVEFTLDENFNELVRSRCRDEFSYASFSEGEKKRIDIAILFAWRQVARMKNSVNCNILFLDEILDGSLDSDGMDAVFKIIEDESKQSNVFVISHNDHFKDQFTNVITIKKIGDFSVVQ